MSDFAITHYKQAVYNYFPKIPFYNDITTIVLDFLKQLPRRDDFEKSYRTVYLGHVDEATDSALKKDLSVLGLFLGFKVQIINDATYLKDSIFLSGDTLVCPNLSQIEVAKERVFEMRNKRSDSVAFHTDHPHLATVHMGTFDRHVDVINKFSHQIGIKTKQCPFYFEGGNHFIVSHPKYLNRKVCLIGTDGFLLALLQLRLLKFFENNPYQTPQEFSQSQTEIDKNLSENETSELLKELFYLQLLLVKGSGDVTIKLEKHKASAVKFKAQKETLKRVIGIVFALWPKNFVKKMPFNKLPGDDVVIVPQMFYHLDIFIHPAPDRGLFIQNFDLCIKFLEEIKKETTKYQLTLRDHYLLEELKIIAGTLSQELDRLTLMIETQLKTIGFSLIRFPGVFFSSQIPNFLNTVADEVNFINGISGCCPLTKRKYFILSGAKSGNNLGVALMDKLSAFLNRLGIEVFYVGRNLFDSRDFSPVEGLWPYSHAGLHCLTVSK